MSVNNLTQVRESLDKLDVFQLGLDDLLVGQLT